MAAWDALNSFSDQPAQARQHSSRLSLAPSVALADVAQHIRSRNFAKKERQVWVLMGRDNPALEAEEAFQFFETLRVLFREEEGRVVVCWPITDVRRAEMLSAQAWAVGRDSVVDLNKGLYHFTGPTKTKFFDIADLTTRTLSGQSLEVFGVTRDVGEPLAAASETISEFYTRLEAKSAEINGLYRDLLKDRPVPNVWVLVGGDSSKDLNLTVANLTAGTQNYVDIDQIVSYLDNPDLDAAFLLRMLDVRVFELPPNVSLAAIRAFGAEDVRQTLKLQKASEASAVDALQKSAFIQAILDPAYSRNPYSRDTELQASQEYRRVQVKAGSDDKKLNKALALGVAAALAAAGVTATVVAEKQADESSLKPDIRITLADGRLFCLEPTWRSTGEAIDGEIKERQNTLTVGHIRKYLLEKVLGYVNDLNL
jgi:hypothetical protein